MSASTESSKNEKNRGTQIWTISATVLGYFFFYAPFAVKNIFSHLLAFLFFDLFKFRYKIVMENLNRVFPKTTQVEKQRIGRISFYHLWYNFFELLAFPAISDAWIKKNVTFHGLDHYRNAEMKGKGVLILSLHMGHGDMAISMMARQGLPMNVISKHFKNKMANEFWFGLRKKFGAKFIDPHGMKTPFDILKALKKNEAVVFVLDQYMGPPYGVETTFFGELTGTAYGLALFALKSEAPVIPVFGIRGPLGTYQVHFEREVPFEPQFDSNNEIDKDKTILHMTQIYNHHLEDLIRSHPEDWMWIHRRWKPFYSPPL